MAARASSPASAFSKVLRSFETGGFTYRDVVAELKRLLKAGASPTELSEILRRREFVEPLPVQAHREVLGLLDAAKGRAAAEAIDKRVESDGASSGLASIPVVVPDERSSSHPGTVRIPTIVPRAARAEGVPNTTIRIAPPPRIPVPIPLPESRLITTPVQMPAARATPAPMPARGSPSAAPSLQRSPDADGPGNIVARAITLARISASPARTSASPDSAERRTGRIAPAKAGGAAPGTAGVSAPGTAGVSPPGTAGVTAPGTASVAVRAPRTAKIPTLNPPAEEPVADGKPAQALSHELDDWSDLAIVREDLTADPVAEGNAHQRRGVASRGSMARVIGWSVVALILAAIAWFYGPHAPLPTEAALPAAAAPIPGTLIRDCPTCAAMMVLPAARFKQGFAATDRGAVSYEKPQHWVTIIRPFAMSADLVTVEEYRQFIDATGRDVQGCETYDGAWKYRPENSWRNPGFAQSGLHPVTCVSWNDAVAYAQWLSTKTGHQYRLPSASEWEYAARAGSDTVYPWAANGSNACTYANVADASAARQYPGWVAFACDDGYANTSPVGSFKANALGLNDMLGNVFQWTLDCWQADYRGAPADGSARTDGDCSERELRGGSWFTSPAYVRANYRNHFASDYRTSSVGIRLVRDIGP
jgi:formylglycine-generating enzyme required for sulfatase activity